MTDSDLHHRLQALGRPDTILIGSRVIGLDDAGALFPAEAASLGSQLTKARRQSGAARIVARQLLASMGFDGLSIIRSNSGPPVWPAGVVGSLSHDDDVAVATVAAAGTWASLGIDVEPAKPLSPDLVEIVATSSERENYGADMLACRLLFSVKESVFKATYPLDGVFLNFQDIEVDIAARQASVRSGRTVDFAYLMAPRIVSLAFIRH